jgi:hypothetical protein
MRFFADMQIRKPTSAVEARTRQKDLLRSKKHVPDAQKAELNCIGTVICFKSRLGFAIIEG